MLLRSCDERVKGEGLLNLLNKELRRRFGQNSLKAEKWQNKNKEIKGAGGSTTQNETQTKTTYTSNKKTIAKVSR